MDRKLNIFLSVLCVTLAAIYASDLTPPADIEGELGSIASRTPLFQDELKPDYEQQQNFFNDDPDLIDQTTYPTESISAVTVHENEATESPKNVQYDQTTLDAYLETTDNEETIISAKETQPPTQNTPTIQNMIESTTNQKVSFDGTTISSQALDWTSSRSIGYTQNTTELNVINEATQPANENTAETGSSTTAGYFLTTTQSIDTVNSSKNNSTPELDNAHETTPSGPPESPTPTLEATVSPRISLPNMATSVITQTSAQYTSTTLMSPSVNDMVDSFEEEETTASSEDGRQSISTDIPAPNGLSPTSAVPDIFQNNTTFVAETDISDTDATDAPNEVILHNNHSTTEDMKIASLETTPQNVLVTTTSKMFTSSESFATTIHPNNKTNLNTTAKLETYCNNDNTCSDDEVCASHVGDCICVSNLNASSDQPLCQNYINQDEVTPSSISPTVDQKFENTMNNSNQVTQRDFEHVFFTKKWKELSSKQKSRNTVTLSFSPAPEVAEWFQTYDWKFRQHIALALTAYLQNSIVNDSDYRHIITPFYIVYVAPTPFRDDEAITVSILVLAPWNGVNNSFLDNRIIIGCLSEGLKECEAELELTVNKIEGVFPKRLLGESTFTVAGLSPTSVKLLFICAVISLTLTVLTLVLLMVKCRHVRSRFDPRSGLYRHPRVLMRSPGDGHNLATDEQCQQGEGRRCDPENGNVVGKVETDTWVVPLEEVPALERGTKTDKNDDTKV